MPDTCPGYSPEEVPAVRGCKHCGGTYAAHAPITTTEPRTYRVGELLTLKSGAQWRVRNLYSRGGGRIGVGLVDPNDPNHGTAFFADVLDTLVVAEPARPTYPESGDYPVGDYTVSARVVLDDESVVIVSGTGGRQLLQATPAEARALSTALRVAADQADADAGTDADECEYLAAGGPCTHVISCEGPPSVAPVEQTSIAPSFGLLAGDERVFGNPSADDAPGYPGDGYPLQY